MINLTEEEWLRSLQYSIPDPDTRNRIYKMADDAEQLCAYKNLLCDIKKILEEETRAVDIKRYILGAIDDYHSIARELKSLDN